MTAAALHSIEPSVTFTRVANAVTGSPVRIAAGVTMANAGTVNRRVAYDGAASTYSVASVSASNNKFGVYVNKGTGGGSIFVKVVGSATSAGW
jgi:hypothetical protein